MRLRNKVVSLSMALAVSGMLAMSGSKVYASDTDTYNNQILNGGSKEATEYVEIQGSKKYWVEWVFSYDYKDYLLKHEKGAEKPTITEVTAATSR